VTKVFCDTNILIAAFLQNHASHDRARPVVERIKAGKDTGFAAAHSLAEAYSVLTRLPNALRVAPTVAWQLIQENVVKGFSVIALTAKEYAETLAEAAAHGIEGGPTYDALLLKAAAKSGADRIYTLNLRHFQALAGPQLRSKILAP
jgi:predicted nucleic acid-binding protein